MTVNTDARERSQVLSEPMSFRHFEERRDMLEAFARADGYDTLTPILREAVDLYIVERLRKGKSGVQVHV